ncbi:MAG: hypothetical protein AB9882_06570 [Ignavibacteriaceae bacterium]
MDFTKFNKIGFGDLYMLSVISNNPYTTASNDYRLLKELGLTHIATYADSIPLNNGQNLKIIDRNFERDIYAAGSNNAAFIYSYAMGNKNFLPYEIGGYGLEKPFELSDYNNWGYGNSGLNPSDVPFRTIWQDTNVIGEQMFYDYAGCVAFADLNNPSHQAGDLVFLTIPFDHQPFNTVSKGNFTLSFLWKGEIYMRVEKNDNLLPDDTIAVINIYEEYPRYFTGEKHPALLLNTTFYILNSQFNGDLYTEIRTPFFPKKLGSATNLVFKLKWLRKCNMYADKVSIFNQFYESLFAGPLSERKVIEEEIINSSLPNMDHPNYEHPYLDEPVHMQYYGVQNVSKLWQKEHKKFIKGADMFYQRDYLELIEFQHVIKRPPYILSDCYPLNRLIDSASNPAPGLFSLQKAFDRLIDTAWGSDYKGTHRQGFRQMISWAHRFDHTHSNVSQHIPFYHTIQCQGEFERYGGKKTFDFRVPAYNEIIAQGWLAICYGAKGLMYYNIYTASPPGHKTNDGYYVYGLFDSGKPDTNSSGDLIYSAAGPHLPNKNYYAVRELNSQIDAVSSELMQLTWTDGYSLHKRSLLSDTYIASLISWESPGADGMIYPEPDEETYIELGLFKKTDQFDDEDLDYFVLVNRRCLTNEGRFVEIEINKSSTEYRKWKLTDIAGRKTYSISDKGKVTIYINPGSGKLFRLEPELKVY